MSLVTCRECGREGEFYVKHTVCKACDNERRANHKAHYEWQSWQVDVSAPDMNNWLSLGDGNYITVVARD